MLLKPFFVLLQHEAKYTSGGRGRRGRGRGGYGGRTENGQSLKFEDDLEDASPEGSESPSPENWSLSHEVASWNKVASHKNNQRSSELKVRDFDLNVEPDENGEFATSPERELEGRRSWPLFGINEMKIDSDQREVSADEEDYDEESIDED